MVLARDVETLMDSTNPYLKKKAILCALRIVKRIPSISITKKEISMIN